ncbi:hypothetical protein F5Y18DRAFT_428255 [Xylariaceae sp. FL1019]|nr:hypothetical protein F5Y18DRAFT_428255 [Xylariaceae sp. FL1019]
MSLPQPPIALTGCSVIFNNTLYAYSSAGFQSLELNAGAQWKKQKLSGELVKGGVCVGSTPKDSSTAGLFIVGGTSSSSDYAGLQKFTYSTGKWETITSTGSATKDRVYHSAVYLNGTDSILIYAGTTNGKPNLSQQNFLIQASEPYGVLSSSSVLAPAVVAPLLLPWSDTEAVLIGGTTSNTEVMIFDTEDKSNSMAGSWRNSGVTLAEPLSKNTTMIKGIIVNGNDKSKHLYTFDPTTSPNTVNRTVLLDGNGDPIGQSAPVHTTAVVQHDRTSTKEAEIIERDATANDWPAYNATLAPSSTRTDYSIARDENGLVVMSGGNQDDVLCMFNVYENSWLNASHILAADTFTIQSSPSVTSSTTSASSTTTVSPLSTTTSTASEGSATTAPAAVVPAQGTKHGLAPTTILGISLGSIFGAAIILVLILLLLRRRHQRRSFIETGHARRASGIPDNKDFLDDDMAKASGGYFRGHAQQESQNSFSSMAIFLGKPQKPVLQRKASSNEKKRVSNDDMYGQNFKNTISRPQPQPTAQLSFLELNEKPPVMPASTLPRPRAPPSEAQDSALRRSSGWNRYWSGASTPHILGIGGTNANSRRNTEVSDESSRYSDMHRMTQDSATVPPLQVDGRPSFHRVNSGSPTVSQYDPRITEGISGHIERPVSPVSSSGYSSGIPPSVHEAWDPTEPKKPWGSDRAPSSAYSQSTMDEPAYQTALGAPNGGRQPTGMSRQPQLAVAKTSSDMSWLNLGDEERSNNYYGRSYR